MFSFICTFGFFCLFLQANLQLFFEMSKEKGSKLTSMGLVTYHESLSRSERVELKNYVASLFRLSYSVVQKRFAGGMEFTAAELIALQPVIEEELWRH